MQGLSKFLLACPWESPSHLASRHRTRIPVLHAQSPCQRTASSILKIVDPQLALRVPDHLRGCGLCCRYQSECFRRIGFGTDYLLLVLPAWLFGLQQSQRCHQEI